MRAITAVALSAAAVAMAAGCSVSPLTAEEVVPDLAMDEVVDLSLFDEDDATVEAHLLGTAGGATHYVYKSYGDDAADPDAPSMCLVVVLPAGDVTVSGCGSVELVAQRGLWLTGVDGVAQESAVAYLAPVGSDLDAIPEGVDWYETPGGAAVITEDLTEEQWDAIVG